MADTFVQLPDDGLNTGKKEDHYSIANGNLREAVVIGDPSVVAGVAPVSATNGLAVDAKTLAPDAATETTLASIDGKIPASPSTTGKQDTGNTSLAAIDTNAGATTDAAVTGDNAGTISAKLRGLNKLLADVWDSTNHWLKVSIQNATLAVTQSGTWNITNVSGTVSLPTGAATETTLGGVLTTSDFDDKTGSKTETAPTTDTASSGLNGRLQRIAQRLTSLITAVGSPFQAGGSIGNTTFASTIADGADATLGAVADAAVTAGATGTISAKLRSISRDLVANIVLAAGGNIIGKVGIDQTTPGTTDSVTVATAQGAGATIGVTTGSAVVTDANGTLQQYLRGLIKLLITRVQVFVVATGGAATNVAVADNPLNLGAQAVSSENSAVTTARMVQLVADLVGKLIVLPYANPENFVSGVISSAMSGTTSTSCVASPGGSLRNYITQITVSNASTTVPTDILIQDGSGGTTFYIVPAPAGTGTGTGAGGATVTLPTPLRQPSTATAIYVANVTTGSSTKVSMSGYKGL